ncbi:hypothetical protein A2890_02275 [candidate division WWE3 bacterium RIFCSPLOWO2_01_FULL_53_14]|uniref:Uncharacterized protein n=1 Tax=candidate division WWE3 bacterium RIFCSPLOWO2_01_FULL_53_14 TaxID=1802628 RepID=A0A1F4VVQ0_UNCKA|nr:MAG: hypothetical protein A2890_02275 [candidate division WWE3 bacterium RIFCSPLOWO2_01_FULL_53_14]
MNRPITEYPSPISGSYLDIDSETIIASGAKAPISGGGEIDIAGPANAVIRSAHIWSGRSGTPIIIDLGIIPFHLEPAVKAGIALRIIAVVVAEETIRLHAG